VNRKTLSVLAVALALGAPAFAQTRTVSKTSGDFNTLAAAVAFFTSSDPDTNAPNIIQITDSSVYDEAISVTIPVTIEGVAATRPIIACQPAPVQADANDGLVVSLGSPGSVTLRNLILIPSKTSTPSDDVLRMVGADSTFTLENILITANNGSDAPVTSDGLSDPSLVGATVVGDDGAHFTGVNAVYNLTNFVASAVTGDGIVCGGSAGIVFNINDGCIFSYNGRLGIQAHGAFTINAPTNRVLVLGNKGFAGIWFAGGHTVRIVNGANVVDNVVDGIEHNNDGGAPFSLSNAIIAGNGDDGLMINNTSVNQPISISNVTIADNAGSPIEVADAASPLLTVTAAITVSDSIIAGPGLELNHSGATAMTISNSAIVTAGPNALPSANNIGTGTINTASIINADPIFTSTTYGTSLFYNVTSGAYASAGTGSTALAGGGTYNSTAVDSWSLYKY